MDHGFSGLINRMAIFESNIIGEVSVLGSNMYNMHNSMYNEFKSVRGDLAQNRSAINVVKNE